MRILHVISNRKWTERAEPAAELAAAQMALGHDVSVACGRATPGMPMEDWIGTHLQARGLPAFVLDLTKHFRLRSGARDVPQLRELMRTSGATVVHTHMNNALTLSAWAIRGMSRKPALVHTSYEPDRPPADWRTRLCHRFVTGGLVVPTQEAADAAARLFRMAPSNIVVAEPGIDLERFNPARELERPPVLWGLGPGRFAVGMVTRIRADRRVDVAVDAIARLAGRMPQLRLLLVGRGEGEDAIREQVAQLGLEDRVIFAGYCRGDDLARAYRAMDLLLYLVPGTDPSCRTVRESMASGRAVVASRQGFLPKLVEDGRTGWHVDLDADGLAGVLEELVRDPERVRRAGAEARVVAEERFNTAGQAEKVLALYQRLA